MSESSKVFNISLEPSDTTVADEKSTLLEVQVSYIEVVSYQWMKEDQPLSDSSSFSGTHSSMLFIYKSSQGVLSGQPRLSSVVYFSRTNDCHIPTTRQTASSQLVLLSERSSSRLLVSQWDPIHLQMWHWLIQGRAVENLVLEGEVDDILQTKLKSTVSLIEAFNHYEEGALIIVEGLPGSGKKTLLFKMTNDWVNGKMLRKDNEVF